MIAYLLDDVPKALLAGLVATSALLTVLTLAARWWGRAGWLRLPDGRRLLWLGVVLAAAIFMAVAEDVVEAERQEWIAQLDGWVRTAVRGNTERSARATAAAISRLTGEGLVLFVAGVATGLVLAQRAPDAALLLGVTIGAWTLTGMLKLAFGVTRPRVLPPGTVLRSFGFPSGHALVSMVALGMVAWLLGRGARIPTRAALYAGAFLVAAGAGWSRIVLDAHWLSDVIGGLALGALCVGLVNLVVVPPTS